LAKIAERTPITAKQSQDRAAAAHISILSAPQNIESSLKKKPTEKPDSYREPIE